jgi:hypothetical protein
MASGQSADKSAQENIRAMGKSYFAFYLKHPAYFKILNTMDPADDFRFDKYEISKDIAAANSRIWQTVCAPIVQGIECGVFKADTNPLEIGMTLWMGSTGIINLMDHVDSSPHHAEDYEGVPSEAPMKQIKHMNFEKMMTELWEAIINQMTIKNDQE